VPVPETSDSGIGSVLFAVAVAGVVIAVGLSLWPCDVLPMATVEMACLKINCPWWLVSSTTEYLSKERIRPVNFTPLRRQMGMLVRSLRAVLRKEDRIFCDGLCCIADLRSSHVHFAPWSAYGPRGAQIP